MRQSPILFGILRCISSFNRQGYKGRVLQKLGEEFVLKGQISKELAKVYSILSDYRHKGDYNDLFEFDSEVLEKLFEPIAEFIDRIEAILHK